MKIIIKKVINDVNLYLPESIICVVDNNSTDKTKTLAMEAFYEIGYNP